MQIAKVVPKVKTSGEGIFDYAIPPELLPMIKIGLLVQVPFRGRKIEGIVTDIKRSSLIPNLKPIISIIDTNPVIDKIHTDLATWMSEYYLEDFSKSLFEMIVPPAKRTIKKQDLNVSIQQMNLASKSIKKYLIRADFKDRLQFYLRAINKTVKQKKGVIIIVPDLSLLPYFTKFLKNYTIIHSNMTLTERWKEWNKVREGKTNIVLGANSALFSPINNLGLIIIDQEESETYKSDQAPRFHVINTAEKLAEITGARLIMGSITPSLASFTRAKNENYLYEVKTEKSNITLVDMNLERSVLSGPLKLAIEDELQQKKRILLVLNRKGEGSFLKCTDCNWIFKCPTCDLNLTPQKDKAYCSNCEKNFPLPGICPKCQSSNLQFRGLSTTRLKKILLENWPDAKIIQIEKSIVPIEKNEQLRVDWDIAIVTNYALKMSLPKIDLVALIDADQGLNSPDFRAEETLFQNQYKFLRLSKRTLIQTHLPENIYFKRLANLDFQGFIQDQLNLRKKYLLPPFVKIIALSYRNKNQKKATESAIKVYQLLKEIIEKNSLEIEISEPITKLKEKKRDFYYQQIIVKYKKRNDLFFSALRKLKADWIIDIDPFNLL